MRKTKLLVIFILCALVCVSMIACSNVDQAIEYNNTISSRYADSFEITSSYKAPQNAQEYVDIERVTQKVLLDTRIEGNHTFALYAPKGEEIEIIIESNQVDKNNCIVINPNLENEKIINLNATSTKFTSEAGGIVEFNYKGGVNKSNCTTVTVKGCVPASCYRYGVDKKLDVDNVGKYITLDAANVRIYAFIEDIQHLLDVEKTMFWWQNIVAFMDESFDLSFFSNNYSPLNIYLTKDAYSIDTINNIVYMPSNIASTILNYNLLYSSDDAKLLEPVKYVSLIKSQSSLLLEDIVDKNSVGEIVAALAYAKFVDEYQANDNDLNYILKQSECIKKALNNDFANDKEKMVSLIMTLYYEIGDKIIVDTLKESMAQFDGKEDFIYSISKKGQINTLELLELYGLKEALTQEQIADLSQFRPVYPVANSCTIGSIKNDVQTGLHFKIGQNEIVDFTEGLVAPSGWQVYSVKGDNWSIVENGKYQYSPKSNKLKDSFELHLKNGEQTKVLVGNLTVDVDVSSYSLYSNIKYDALNTTDKLSDAIKRSDSIKSSQSKSLYKAEVPKEDEIDTTSYSLAVTTGCMQVPSDEKYVFYLRSSGLCRVVFGVEDHNFVMFENSLTVGEYTEELKYEITLQEGYKYYYTIYVLSNKGSGYANLAIKSETNPTINEIDRNYLICSEKKIKRENIVLFEPQSYVKAYKIQDGVDNVISTKQIREKSENLIIEQNGDNIKIATSEISNDVEKFILPLLTSSKVDYVKINVENMDQVSIKVTSGADFSNILVDAKLKNGENYFEIENARYLSEIKFEFIYNGTFNVKVNSLEIGEKLQEMEIVSSSSTDIEYIGEWNTSHKYIGMNNSVTISSSSLSSISYKFNGDEISVYAVKDLNFGSASIHIDGKDVASIDLSSPQTQCAQLIFNAKLEEGDHVIEIKANGDSPITLDYFAVSKLGESKINNDFSKLWYVVFIPALIFIAGIVCISLDIKEKKKKKEN